MIRGAGVLLLCLPALALPARAQSFGARLGAANLRAEQIAPTGDTTTRDGIGWTFDGAVGMGPATLAVRYVEGSLSGETAGEADADLVEGEALLWLAPLRWAALGAGPHVRVVDDGGGSERWVLWEVRVQGNARLTSAVGGYLEGWTVLGSQVPVPEPVDRVLGLEAGLRLGLGRLPFSARLRYRVEHLRLGGGTRRETVEQLGVALGVGRR